MALEQEIWYEEKEPCARQVCQVSSTLSPPDCPERGQWQVEAKGLHQRT